MRSIGGPDRPRTEGDWLVQAIIVVVVSTTIIPDFVSDIIYSPLTFKFPLLRLDLVASVYTSSLALDGANAGTRLAAAIIDTLLGIRTTWCSLGRWVTVGADVPRSTPTLPILSQSESRG